MRFGKILGAIALTAGLVLSGTTAAFASTGGQPGGNWQPGGCHGTWNCCQDDWQLQDNPCGPKPPVCHPETTWFWVWEWNARCHRWQLERRCRTEIICDRCIPQVVSIFDDQHGHLTTDAMLTVGEKLKPLGMAITWIGSRPYTVTSFSGNQALNTVTLSPSVPAAGDGQILDFSTGFCVN